MPLTLKQKRRRKQKDWARRRRLTPFFRAKPRTGAKARGSF